MSNYTILTDSSCNLPDAIIEQYNLPILSLRYMNESEEKLSYSPEEPTDLASFYKNMREGVVYTTSLPYQHTSTDIITKLLEEGQDILYIGFSSGISGTYEATEALLANLSQDYPQRRVYSANTYAAALGEGLLVLHAAMLRESGKSIDNVYQWVLDNRYKLAHWFTVDNLMYLYRGGRVSRTSATAGNLLNIKPVLQVNNEGLLIPTEKVRGRKHSIQSLVKHMQEGFDPSLEPQYVGISHGDCIDDAEYLMELIRSDSRFSNVEFIVNQLDAVIGAHSGPGTLALFYYAHSRD